MSNAHYFYFRLSVQDLDKKVKAFQLDFDHLVNDTFSETELTSLETQLDDIGAVFVQPIFSEMTFDDFYSKESEEQKQRDFFSAARSSICLENIPAFETNPFQVTYLIELLRDFDEVLIDTGGVNELMFKKDYVENLKKYKNIFSLIADEPKKPLEIKTTRPVDPIDFLIQDVYLQLKRLDAIEVSIWVQELPEKTQKVYQAMKDEILDASTLLKKSGLNAKDFDDNLERLKFFLKKH
jgi:hypothetical protein